jgi:hypothetical protein
MSKNTAAKLATKSTASKGKAAKSAPVKMPTDAEVAAHVEKKKADEAAKAPKSKKAKVAAPVVVEEPPVADRFGDIGQTFRRVYKGQEVVAVRVAGRGYTCAQANVEAPDAVYESLTSVVRAITGIERPNGPGWFGLESGTKQARAFDQGTLLGALAMVGNEISADAVKAAFEGENVKVTTQTRDSIEETREKLADAQKVLARAVKHLDARIASFNA